VPASSAPLRPAGTLSWRRAKAALLAAVNVSTVVANVAAQLLALVATHGAPVLPAVTWVAPVDTLLPHAVALGWRQLLPLATIRRLLRHGRGGHQAQRNQRGYNHSDVAVHIHSSLLRACHLDAARACTMAATMPAYCLRLADSITAPGISFDEAC
jgi:hypothetical protein